MNQLDNRCRAVCCVVRRNDIDKYYKHDVPYFSVFEYEKDGELS